MARPSDRVVLALRTSSSSFVGLIIALLAIGYIVVVTFPGWYTANRPGLDTSWVYALNSLHGLGFRFGQDVTFTFGPLGYLLHPLHWRLPEAGFLWATGQACLGAAALIRYLRDRRVANIVLFAVGMGAASSLHLGYDYQLLLLVGLLFSVPPDQGHVWRATSFVGSVLAAALLFMKLNVGLGALWILGVATISWVAKRLIRPRALWGVVAAYIAVLLSVGLTQMGGLEYLPRWARVSLGLASGYSSAMSTQGPVGPVVLGVVALLVYGATILLLRRSDPPIVSSALMMAAAIFVAYKHGFVRHEGWIFFPFFIAVMSLLLLNASSTKSLVVVSLMTATVFPFAAGFSHQYNCPCEWEPEVLTGVRGASNIRALFRIPSVRSELKRISDRQLQSDRLSSFWVERLQREEASVDVIPWEINLIPANGLRWAPNPILQTYSAYTAYLDTLSAQHYTGKSGPKYVLVQFLEIDGRHPMLAAPATWRAVIENYRPVGTDPRLGVFILKRNPGVQAINYRLLKRERLKTTDWVRLPPQNAPLYASIDLSPRLLGKLAHILWRVPPLLMELVYEDGISLVVRVLPETLENGLLLNYLPRNHEEALVVLGGGRTSRMTRFRFTGPGVPYFAGVMEITWEHRSASRQDHPGRSSSSE